jgi:sigma-E factor negative regulatory protein RseA
MNTNLTREQISAFVDNELSDAHIDVALAALHKDEGRDTWNLYHQIGDALRSDELNVPISEGFNARMFARLDAEPTIMAPAIPAEKSYRRFAMPGMAAAAVAVLAVLTVPKMMTHEPAAIGNVTQVAAVAPNAVTVASENGEVLRDPRIDDYLLAHQRFSPSVYSTAQYARSATFAVETDK